MTQYNYVSTCGRAIQSMSHGGGGWREKFIENLPVKFEICLGELCLDIKRNPLVFRKAKMSVPGQKGR